ncbi:MAG: hypothetical protein WCW40_03360 [Bacteroidota bacterium]
MMTFKNMIISALVIAAIHSLNSCASSIPYPTEESVRIHSTGATAFDDAVEGRDLYVKKCSGCHSLYVPEQFSIASWDSILTIMNPRAKLSGSESLKIRLYLSVYSQSTIGTN